MGYIGVTCIIKREKLNALFFTQPMGTLKCGVTDPNYRKKMEKIWIFEQGRR